MSKNDEDDSLDSPRDSTPRPLLGDDYITPEALAKELGISNRTLERWRVSRIGPPRIKIGSTILYRRSAVRAWLDSREVDLRVRRR